MDLKFPPYHLQLVAAFSFPDEDVFSQIRQIDYLLSKSRELKLRSRRDFEETFDELKEMLSPQTIFAVDDALDQLESVTLKVMQKREELRSRATRYVFTRYMARMKTCVM